LYARISALYFASSFSQFFAPSNLAKQSRSQSVTVEQKNTGIFGNFLND